MIKNKFKKIFTNTGPEILFSNKNFPNKANIITKLKYFSFGGKNKNKIFFVIRRKPSAGFFSNLVFVLNNFKICKELNFIPVVDMKNYKTIYNENNKICNSKNAWDYYFKKINKYKLSDVYKSKNVFFSDLTFQRGMNFDMAKNQIKKYIRYIKIRREILTEYKKFKKLYFNKKDKILGVHFRGSTYKTARGHTMPPSASIMIKNIKYLIKKFNYSKVFIVTEEQKYIEILKKEFKEKCICFPSFRMQNEDSFKIYPRKNHRYLLGKEILIETLLLSECSGLTYVKSNVASAAIVLSKKKLKLHEMFLGYNPRNRFYSGWIWYLRSVLPSYIGGLKLVKKNS